MTDISESNLACLFDAGAEEVPDQQYMTVPGASFRQLRDNSERLALALAGKGVATGDRVGLRFSNTIAVAEAHLALWKLGAVPVVFNPGSPSPELVRSAEASQVVATLSSRELPELDGPLTREDLVYLGGGELDGEAAEPGSLPTLALDPGHPAVMLFTSGTTGQPKAVVLTHANLRSAVTTIANDFWQIGPNDIVLMAASNAHIFGTVLMLTPAVARNGLHMLEKFDPRAFLNAIQDERITFIAGVPQVARLLLSPFAEAFDLSSLRRIMLGGDVVPDELVRALKAQLGIEVVVGYGMTEAVPIAFTRPDSQDLPAATVGLVSPTTEVRIIDEAGGVAGTHEVGEIEIRGPQVFVGYFGQERAPEHWRDGWFRTGDLGHLDATGHLFIVDRVKNMIKTGGYSVYPAEVEQVLRTHPAVQDVVVSERPHSNLGAVVQAHVVRSDAADVSATELIRFAKEHLTAYKVPRSVVFHEELPRISSGKVDRQAFAPQRVQ